MIDIAQLREALELVAKPGAHTARETVYHAARVLLAQLEAGALIITPDEETERLIARVISDYQADQDTPRAILDALRDAMPDGET